MVIWLSAFETWLAFPADSLQRGPSICPVETLFSLPGFSYPQFPGGGLLYLCSAWLLTPSTVLWHVAVHPRFLLVHGPSELLKQTLKSFVHTVYANTHIFSPWTDWEGNQTPAYQLLLHPTIRATSQPVSHLLVLLGKISHHTSALIVRTMIRLWVVPPKPFSWLCGRDTQGSLNTNGALQLSSRVLSFWTPLHPHFGWGIWGSSCSLSSPI